MGTVQAVLNRKGHDVETTTEGATVLSAAVLMNERSIGGLVVVDGRRVAGIFTERDIMRRVVAAGRDPATTRVGDVMTRPVACCRPDTTLEECRRVMKEKRIRHLPVVDEGGVRGIVTIGDVMLVEAGEHEATIHYLQEYAFGVR